MPSVAVLPRSSLPLRRALSRERRKRLPSAWALVSAVWAAWVAWDSKLMLTFRRYPSIPKMNRFTPVIISTHLTHASRPSEPFATSTYEQLLGYYYELFYRVLTSSTAD